MKNEKGIIKEFDFNSKEGKELYWHSSAHILATAIKRLYPKVKIAIGPAIENGFYYDFDNLEISDKDFKKIEEEIRKVIKAKLGFKKLVVSKEEALKIFKDEPYKIELIKDLPKNEEISVYWLGDEFVDLCRGPHVENSGIIQNVKLLKLAGAYWRGKSDNKMLTRIYAISFPKREELKEYLTFLQEAKRRDHRVIGEKLDLFSFSEYAPGFPFFHDNGIIVLDELVDYWKELHRVENYEIIRTPQIMKRELWEKSGHWAKYKENMYTVEIEKEQYAIKPMNCPGGMLLYNKKKHSYKEFPLRVGELGFVHRHELSGTLGGLFRVRAFTQDDAHIFMSQDMIKSEIKEIFKLVDIIYGKFNLPYRVVLSTRPEKYIGAIELWNKTENSLKDALKDMGFDYELNEGDGAFYGPKIDILVRDAIGREHQCGTIQLDMNLPERFDLNYIGADNQEHRPVMLHRVIYGSLERFFGILIEHFAGKFPLWLNPKQVVIVPVADAFKDYALKLEKELKVNGLRAKADVSEDSMSKKIRIAEKQYVNYILVVGEKEVKENAVNVRIRDLKTKKDMSFKEFLQKIVDEKKKREIKSLF